MEIREAISKNASKSVEKTVLYRDDSAFIVENQEKCVYAF